METWKSWEWGLSQETEIQAMAGKQLQEHKVNENSMQTMCMLCLKFLFHEGLWILAPIAKLITLLWG